MSKSDIVKLRIEPQRKQAWRDYATSCRPSLSLPELVEIAVDYFVSGKSRIERACAALRVDDYTLAWALPKTLGSRQYLETFLDDASRELERKKERNEKRLSGEYD